MSNNKAGTSKTLYQFLKFFDSIYMKHLFKYSIDNEQLQGIKPPYIVLANHTNFWDPFLLALCIPESIYYVTSNAYFRNPVLKHLLKLVGAIPKTKMVSDPMSIRAILDVIKNNGVIGIFPEGKRNWDGRTLPLLYPTAKLIKHLGIPVVSVLFKGACLSMPRWSSSTKKGSLTMTLSKVLDQQDIAALSADQIFSRISESLSYDEYDYQREHMHLYGGKNKAERLERFIFACPSCSSIGKLVSEKETFSCSNCGYKVLYNSYGFFETNGQKLYYDNTRDWNLWQLEYLDAFISSQMAADNQSPLLEEHHVILKIGQHIGPLKTQTTNGTLSIFTDRLEYCMDEKVIHRFHIGDISGENIQFNNQLEFISNKTIYRFSVKDGNMSAYKWVNAIKTLKGLMTVEADCNNRKTILNRH